MSREQIRIDIGVRVGAFALAVDVALAAEGIQCVFGRSGSGKTTLVNTIAGVVRPERGVIQIGETTLFDRDRGIDLPVHERAVGYVFQESRLFPHLSVEGNLEYGQVRARRRNREIRIKRDVVLDILGIGALLQRRIATLSGGERQRVALARALLAQPRILLMDEPLAALDFQRKAEVLPYIEHLRDQFGIPIVYVTHSFDEVVRLADNLVIMDGGHSVASGSLVSVSSSPENAKYFGRYEAGSVIECVVASHDAAFQISVLKFADGELRVPQVTLAIGERVRVHLRARDISVSLMRQEGLSISNQLEGRIEALLERPGPYLDVAIAIGSTLIHSMITRDSAHRLGLQVGGVAFALIKSVSLDRRSVAG